MQWLPSMVDGTNGQLRAPIS